MRFLAVLFVLGLVVSAGSAQSSMEMSQPQCAPGSARAALERMSPAERKNSNVSLEFENSDSEVVALGREVELLWNDGRYDDALAQLGDLEARAGQVAVANTWRTPVPTFETNLWAQDVRISNRDSLIDLAFDADAYTGNLFVVLRRAGLPHFTVCMSTDTGATWDETFTWSGSPPMSLDAMVFTNRLYVAYNSPAENAQEIRLRRFLCSSGRADTFGNRGNWIAPCTLNLGDTMREVSFTSNYNLTSGWLYLAAIISDGSVWCGFDFHGAGTWSPISTGITSGASQGLDFAYNTEGDSSHYLISYYDTSDTLRVCSKAGGTFTRRFSLLTGRGSPTSISGRRDTIICVYEDGAASPHQARYVVNYDDGDTWVVGTLSNADTAADAPAVTLGGGGFAAVYRHCSPARELRFRRLGQYGPWSAPVAIGDHEPYWSRPAVKCLDTTGVFGVVYLCNTSPVARGAYFDRSDWAYGIEETMSDERVTMNVGPTIVRGVLMLGAVDSRQNTAYRAALLDVSGRKVLGLRAGANDVSRLAPGVYFVHSTLDNRQSTMAKVVVAR